MAVPKTRATANGLSIADEVALECAHPCLFVDVSGLSLMFVPNKKKISGNNYI